MKKHLPKLWRKKPTFLFLLYPLSWIFRIVVGLRRTLYRRGLLSSKKFNVPIIVVGNINVGGTGKTPVVIQLVSLLQSLGYHPGVVSRGYGGNHTKLPVLLDSQSRASDVGDEPLLIAKRTHVPVVVCQDRVQAVEKLLENSQINVILSDDGLQHYAMQRTIEIAMVDGERLFENNQLIPAGPLRESISRLQEVDFVLINGTLSEPSWNTPTFSYAIQVQAPYQLNIGEADPKKWANMIKENQPIYAVTAIGNPARFYQTLSELGLVFMPIEFPDHYLFRAQDFSFAENNPVVMTEKDAIKCFGFAKENWWCVPISADLPLAFKDALFSLMLHRQTVGSRQIVRDPSKY